MSNYREFGLHFLTTVLIIMVPFFVVPNLSTSVKNYESEIKILESTRINEREYTGKFFQKRVERTLILKMTDQTEITLSNQYQKYWDKFQSEENIGKHIKYYLGNNTSYGSNPVQVEIENQIIYNPTRSVKWGYILVLMTIGMTIYSGHKIKKHFENSN